MKVLKITDQKDGSAIVDLEMTDEENNILVEYAVVDILKKQLMSLKEKEPKKECFKCCGLINKETIKNFPDTEICADCIND